jgi:hypothetical protein
MMTRPIDCVYFGEQLDALMEGTLPDDAKAHLRAHAAECAECSTALRIQDHLLGPPLDSIEAEVPREHLDTMWERVGEAIQPVAPETSQPDSEPVFQKRGWLVSTLAAASLVLLLATSGLGLALSRSKASEARLANQMAEFEHRLGSGASGEAWIQRTGELQQNPSRRAKAVAYHLQGADEVDVDGLLDLLARLPSGTIILDAESLEAMYRTPGYTSSELRELLVVLNDAVVEIQPEHGLRAGDFADWLSNAALPNDLSVPTTALLELLS